MNLYNIYLPLPFKYYISSRDPNVQLFNFSLQEDSTKISGYVDLINIKELYYEYYGNMSIVNPCKFYVSAKCFQTVTYINGAVKIGYIL